MRGPGLHKGQHFSFLNQPALYLAFERRRFAWGAKINAPDVAASNHKQPANRTNYRFAAAGNDKLLNVLSVLQAS